MGAIRNYDKFYPYFKDGFMNRDPCKPSVIKTFKHGKGFGYNPKIEKSPLQKEQVKREKEINK